jgi:hypothetical protein
MFKRCFDVGVDLLFELLRLIEQRSAADRANILSIVKKRDGQWRQ